MVLIISTAKPLHKDIEAYIKSNFTSIDIDKAYDYSGAVSKIEENVKYDMIISDWDNFIDGYDLLQRVRKNPDVKKKSAPFVIITARRDNISVVSCIQAAVTGYITKPLMSQTIDYITIDEKLGPYFEKLARRIEGIPLVGLTSSQAT
ncbi:MAG: response regulator [Nitrospirae bacterium]|nr:response regulator [Nitrospirota bacterium]